MHELLVAKRKSSGTLPAGALARWLEQYLQAQTQADPAGEVPCGDCHACCKASYFIAIAEDETETIARIPRVHLTLSTRSQERRWALDQSRSGSCPMLVDEACSIYEHRPLACRRFDCRVFAATSVAPGAGRRAAVNQQVWRWRFDYPRAGDALRQTALLDAAAFLQQHAELIDPDVAPADTGQLAKAAVFVHELFLPANTQYDERQLAAALNRKLHELALEAE